MHIGIVHQRNVGRKNLRGHQLFAGRLQFVHMYEALEIVDLLIELVQFFSTRFAAVGVVRADRRAANDANVHPGAEKKRYKQI